MAVTSRKELHGGYLRLSGMPLSFKTVSGLRHVKIMYILKQKSEGEQ